MSDCNTPAAFATGQWNASAALATGQWDVLTLALRVKPGASGTKVGGCYHGRYGPALVVAVNVPAVDGRATEAALRAVADALGIKYRHLRLTAGHTSRDKLVDINVAAGDIGAGRNRAGDIRAGDVGAGGIGAGDVGAEGVTGAILADRIAALRDAA